MIKLPLTKEASGVYDREKHAALVHNLEHVVEDARVPEPYLWVRFGRYAGAREMQWAAQFRQQRREGWLGLIYLGAGFVPPVDERCFALVGALTRNFIRARLFTVAEAVEAWNLDDLEATCLVIPNFVEAENGKMPRKFKREPVSDLLLSRFRQEGVQTVLAAPSLEEVGNVYGSFVRSHIESHYVQVTPDMAEPVLTEDAP